MVKVLLIDNLNLKTYLADVTIGCSNPPQGKMNLDWMGLYFYRLFERAKYSEIIEEACMNACAIIIKSSFTTQKLDIASSEKLHSYPLTTSFSSASGLKLNLLDIEFDWYYGIGGVGVACYLGNIGT